MCEGAQDSTKKIVKASLADVLQGRAQGLREGTEDQSRHGQQFTFRNGLGAI